MLCVVQIVPFSFRAKPSQQGHTPESSSAPVKREPTTPLLPLHASRTTSRRSSGLVRIKPELEESTTPRKRLSDTAFGVLGNTPSHKPVSIKKLKTEQTPKTPLAPLSNTFTASELPTSRAVPPPPDIQETRARLQEVQAQIAAAQTSLDRIKRKTKKSKADLTRMNGYMQELQTLNMLKAEYNAAIPSLSPLKRTHSMASLHSPIKSENMFSHPFPGSCDSDMLPQPFDKPVAKSETKPFPLFSNADDWPAVDAIPVYVERKPFPVAAENPFCEYKPQQPVASGSNVKLPSGPTLIEEKITTTSQAAQPVASGSNVPLPYAHAPYSHWDSDEEMTPAITDDLIARVGIKVPAPIRTDHEDDNGDFHGRGRDLYVGPQAKADEYVSPCPNSPLLL